MTFNFVVDKISYTVSIILCALPQGKKSWRNALNVIIPGLRNCTYHMQTIIIHNWIVQVPRPELSIRIMNSTLRVYLNVVIQNKGEITVTYKND